MSDHFSGPRAIAGPAGDICDVYAFPSPQTPGRLVLVMTVWPRAHASTMFSDGILYRFRLRPASIADSGGSRPFTIADDELAFEVTFPGPDVDRRVVSKQLGRCTTSSGECVEFVVGDQAGGRPGGLRVFAGLRSDPFFVDLPALQETIMSGRLAFKGVGQNSLAGCNVLAVVVEADCAALVEAAGGTLFAVVGETVAAGKLRMRIERVGRPEVKNVILSWKEYDTINRDLEVRDLYNLEDAFHLGADYRGVYCARFNANLAVFDRVDGTIDWPPADSGAHPLTELLLADYLVVDVARPYREDSFLEIERAALTGRPHATCGGRSLNDDVMDTLYTVLIGGPRGTRISDGLDGATVQASRAFPYLAPANS